MARYERDATMIGEVIVVDDVGVAFGALVAEAFKNRVDHDRFVLGLGGGSTARNAYECLAREPIDWSLVTAVWGDERMVPLDHEDSNYRIAKEALFDHVSPLCDIHPVSDQTSIESYNGLIKGLQPIDLLHLGMGDDGHTASLFPNSPALDVVDSDVIETGDDLHPHRRMTLTFPAINRARLAVFTITGAKKRDMFERVQSGDDLPAGKVDSERVVWIVDRSVAG